MDSKFVKVSPHSENMHSNSLVVPRDRLSQNIPPESTSITSDNITATINKMIKDTNVLSAFELNEKNLQFLKELRKLPEPL